MNLQPIVSVIVPCYNQGIFLEETLLSVLAQNFKNWECILVNDGSTDNTEEICQQYCLQDNRFKYFYKENGGLSSSRNFGILKSFGKFILPLDSDDKIASNYFSLAVAILENEPNVKIVYGRAKYFGKRKGEWLLEDFSFEKLLATNLIYCSGFYRRRDYNQTNGYNENMKFGFEDWDFWISILENGGDVYKIDEIMFYYRIRHRSMARSLDTDKIKYLRIQLYNNHKIAYSRYLLNPINSFEYASVFNSFEYKFGQKLLKPIRIILNLIRKF